MGEEAVSADSGRGGETFAWAGRVRGVAFFEPPAMVLTSYS